MFIAYGESEAFGRELWETPFGEVIEGMEHIEELYSYGKKTIVVGYTSIFLGTCLLLGLLFLYNKKATCLLGVRVLIKERSTAIPITSPMNFHCWICLISVR